MQLKGLISKMHTSLSMCRAQYKLPIGDKLLNMNDLIGEKVHLEFSGQIRCANCGVATKKSYSQGYCFPCCRKLAKCDLCIMKPETCHHHLGTCREPQWGLDNCFTPHVIYLANSTGIKVGITHKQNIPSRWIDQGAISALPILEVDTRLKSGLIEVALKEFVSDKTNWRKMLKNEVEEIDLKQVRDELLPKVQLLMNELGANTIIDQPLEIDYPVIEYPTKVTSMSFDKTPVITGILKGIKGQYLIFDCGVINVRKFSSYDITITY